MRLSHPTEGIMPVRATLHAQVNRASFMGTSRKSCLRLYILAFLERTEDEFSRLREQRKEKKKLFVIHVASMGICYCLLIGIIKLFFPIFKRPFTNA